MDPASVPQGSYFTVRVPGEPVEGARPEGGWGTVSALDRTFPLFPDPAGGFRALVPVPLTAKAGERSVRVELGKRESRAKVRILRRDKGKTQALKSLSVTESRAQAMNEDRTDLKSALRRVTPEARWSGPLRRPTAGRLTAVFGQRRVYGGGATWFHSGLDFAMQSGWPVVASAPGRVAVANRNRTYGNVVVLDHGQTVFTVYMHMKKLAVKEGQIVGQGELLGTMGDTGFALGPHLHFSTYIAGTTVDPEEVLCRGLP